MSSKHQGYCLLTGGTGLLGRFLIRDLLIRGKRLALLVRGSKRESARERLEGILQHWENETRQPLPRPVLIEGDLREPELGLTRESRNWVGRCCDQVIHSAASLAFHAEGDGEPWRTNYEGTRNVLDLCRSTKIRRLHYVSTAYVCGLREGVIYESELDCGQRFRNAYEESKFRAENMVRAADWIDQLTVYRPAVIAGDSQTGYTNTYHGIYLYLRLMALVVPRQPVGPDGKRVTRLRLPMTGEERRNVIPVDWTSRAMSELILTPKAHGQTFHLAPDHCITPREIIEAAYRYFHSSGVEYVGYQQLDPETFNDFEREFLPGVTMYNDYEATDPLFDCSNLKSFAGHIPCPVIDEAMIHRFLKYGETDRWGKRRSKKAEFSGEIGQMMQSMAMNSPCWVDPGWADPADPFVRSQWVRIRMDLLGPGGGEWTVTRGPGGELAVVQGLDPSAAITARMSVRELLDAMLVQSTDTDLAATFSRWVHALCNQLESTGDTSTPSRIPLPIRG